MRDAAMAASLRRHAARCVYENEREVGVRGAGHHVAGILLVSRAIDEDERTARGCKIAIGDVDRDTLFALGGEPVEQAG